MMLAAASPPLLGLQRFVVGQVKVPKLLTYAFAMISLCDES